MLQLQRAQLATPDTIKLVLKRVQLVWLIVISVQMLRLVLPAKPDFSLMLELVMLAQ